MGIYLQTRSDGSTYGTLVIDRVVRGKRLKLTTGTTDKRTARKMNEVIDSLLDRGMDSRVIDLAEKRISIRQLYELDQKGTLYNPQLDPGTVQPLRPTLDAWIASYPKWSVKNRQANKEFVSTMFKKLGSNYTNATIDDVPKILREYHDLCETEDHPRVFNLVRACLQRFVRLKFGKSSALSAKVADVEKLADRPKNPQTAKTPAQIDRLCKALLPKFSGMVWTMCTTGVGFDEYGKMTPRDDLKNKRIYVEGTKLDRKDRRRRREVPFIYAPQPRTGSERHFNKVLKAQCKKLRMTPITAYAFRKCYSNWLGEAGVPEWRVEMYMGHMPTSQTKQYQATEVWTWLNADADLFRKWLASEKEKAKAAEKAKAKESKKDKATAAKKEKKTATPSTAS